ncbi:MAG: Ig-like domain-containing protein [Archangium sp.]
MKRALLLLAVLSGCAPQQSERVDTLLISPANARVARGESLRFVATALLSTGEVRDVTSETVWTVDDDFIGATAGASNLVQGINMGRTRVRAQYAGMMETRSLDVVSADFRALRLEPSQLLVPMGLELPLRLVAIASDGSEVDVTAEATWQLSNEALASMRGGRVWPLRPGTSTVNTTAKDLALSAQLVVTDAIVTAVEIRAEQGDLPAGFSQQLTAHAQLSDGTRLDVTGSAKWSSEDVAIATVDDAGRFSALKSGSVRVTATAGNVTAAISVKVSDAVPVALSIDAAPQRFPAGLGTSLRAVASLSDGSPRVVTGEVTWETENTELVELAGASARGLRVGTAEVKATWGAFNATTRLEVIDAALVQLSASRAQSLPLGASWQPVVTAQWTDGSRSDVSRVTAWLVLDGSVVSIDGDGVVTGLRLGSTRLLGFFGGMTVTTSVSVTPAVLSQLDFEPSSLRLVPGSSAQLRVTGTWTDGTRLSLGKESCLLSAPQPHIATVSGGGRVTAHAPGSGRVIATCLGQRRIIPVRVPDVHVVALQLTPLSPSVPVGFGKQLQLMATLSDGSSQDVTSSAQWSSLSNVARVDAGLVSGLRLGTVVVRADFGGEYAETQLTVTDGVLQALEVTPSTTQLNPGRASQLTAMGRFSDGSQRDMTNEVVWNSDDDTIATVNDGLVTGASLGITQVTASRGDVSASADVEVVAPSLSYLLVSSPPPLPVGRSTTLTLQGVLSDGSVQAMSAQWSSSQNAVAMVDAAGHVEALAAGTSIVTARVGTFTVSVNVTVTSATPTSLQVEASASVVTLNGSARLTAWLNYSDGARFDVTREAVWQVGNPSLLTVDASGVVAPLAGGTTQVTARWGVFSSAATLQVDAAPVLVQLTFSGAEFIEAGDAPSFTAWGEYTDGSTVDVTSQVSWSSSNASVLSSNGGGAFSALAAGVSSVTITLGSQRFTSQVTVR